jgi:TorA maturation chaperone TorD
LASELRKEYSRLFLSPGRLAVIYPYESAFRFVEGGGKGFPTLFANPITNDVEKRMRAADALPEDTRKVPVDSIHRELDFLRVLLTNAAACLHAERPEDARQWLELAEAFRADHIETWVPSFMRRTAAEARHPVYRGLAEVTAGYVQFIA